MFIAPKAIAISALIVVILLIIPISLVGTIVKYLSLAVIVLALFSILYKKLKKKK